MIRLILINDHHLFSNLISATLDDDPEIEVVKICEPDEDLISAIRETEVDVVLISGHLSTGKAIDLVTQIDALDLPLEVLMLGLDERRHSILPYIEAGATGYVLKDATIDELVEAIHAAHRGRARVSPMMARALIERVYRLAGEFEGMNTAIFNDSDLTEREMEVLELVAQNLTNQQIAENLYLEVGTIKNHVHSILQKLDVSSRHEAAKYLAILKH